MPGECYMTEESSSVTILLKSQFVLNFLNFGWKFRIVKRCNFFQAAQYAIIRRKCAEDLCSDVQPYPDPDPLANEEHLDFYGQRSGTIHKICNTILGIFRPPPPGPPPPSSLPLCTYPCALA